MPKSNEYTVLGKGAKNFTTISKDNRLRLWDIDSHKERRRFVEKHHLAHTYCCVAWGQTAKDDLGLFAVGASDGVVVVWDLTRGVVIATLGVANETPIPSDIKFSNDLKRIIVCYSQSSQINEYIIATGEISKTHKGFKKGTQKLAVHPKSNSFIAASGSLKYYDADGSKLKISCPFSTGGASCVVFSDCGAYFACAGEGVGEVLVFDMQAIKNTGGENGPVAVIPVTGSVHSLVLKNVTNKKAHHTKLDIVCLVKENGGCILRTELTGSTPAVFTAPIESKETILTGCFTSNGAVLLATGKVSSPRFVSVPYEEPESGVLKSTVDLPTPEEPSTATVDTAGSAESAGPIEVDVLGPHEMGAVKRPITYEADDDIAPKSKKSRENGVNGVTDGAQQMTMEERLRGLTASLTEIEARERSAKNKGAPSELAPSSDSLVTLLEQALQAGDDTLLEQCLTCGDEDVVTETARRLPASRVVGLLRKLVAKFEKRPSRGIILTRWIHALLRFHTSYLLSVPDLSHQLAALSQMLDQRLSTYTRLASLAGRLDLLMSQITSSSAVESVAAAATPMQVTYED
mmetsp:Transcript_24504/g.36041  ORF Transcript_24504/g.36041 Transcript_24504/m.36041 type:complete len:575 (+) Transcript_24504:73-1797(+)|eukprot:CAMPEP_0185028264 /NCGR_PEP_ID=MMETSP1103-20130426/13928_1 /TAXON_ID=36769 /ORGANISM="Paraphysomonas bandaiensis, Strain Caron Lab Isolate" /LENGTH=574 /DNA_ID=CAMNT_0027562639 /DNA_START=11 /DNA_END=1735 /DNA_ORIENTATION=+